MKWSMDAVGMSYYGIVFLAYYPLKYDNGVVTRIVNDPSNWKPNE